MNESDKEFKIKPYNDNRNDSDTSKSPAPKKTLRDIIPANESDQENSPAADIPTFDLGKQILAEQRKNVAAKRVAPSAAPQKPQTNTEQPKTAQTEPQKPKPASDVIANIVARDLAEFRRNHKH